MTLSIGILSWKSPLTLKQTLLSYKKNGLFDISDEIFIYFNEINNQDIKIAKNFNIDYIGTSKNIGIGQAFKLMVEYSSCEYFLFLENDWLLIENKHITKSRIKIAKDLLQNDKFDAIKLRHRKNYGEPLYTIQYKNNELKSLPHLLDCVHWIEDPSKKYPDYIQKITINNENWYSCNSKFANYTNNPCMYKKNFIKENIIPFSTGDGIALETDLQPWWEKQDFSICMGEGLFSHNRIDRSNNILKTVYSQIKLKILETF